eukprot:gene6684-7771_t
MTQLLFFGCLFVAFSPAIVFFFMVVTRNSQLIILSIGGSFFWLLSMLIASIWWYIIPPMKEQFWFIIPFTIAIQEAFRYLFYRLYAWGFNNRPSMAQIQTQIAQMKMNDINGDQNNQNNNNNATGDANAEAINTRLETLSARPNHTLSSAAIGTGSGITYAFVMYGTIMWDSQGPGNLFSGACPTVSLFMLSAFFALFMSILHIAWNVLAFQGYRTRNYIQVAFVIITHFAVSYFYIVGPSLLALLCADAVIGFTAFFGATASFKKYDFANATLPTCGAKTAPCPTIISAIQSCGNDTSDVTVTIAPGTYGTDFGLQLYNQTLTLLAQVYAKPSNVIIDLTNATSSFISTVDQPTVGGASTKLVLINLQVIAFNLPTAPVISVSLTQASTFNFQASLSSFIANNASAVVSLATLTPNSIVASMDSNVFESNIANYTVYARQASVVITNTTFFDNLIDTQSDVVIISGVVFADASTLSISQGSSIRYSQGPSLSITSTIANTTSNVTLDGVLFSKNAGSHLGTIQGDSGILVINNSPFNLNLANYSPCLFLVNMTANVTNTLFNLNTALFKSGAAIYANNSIVNLVNSPLNSTIGTAVLCDESHINLVNSTITGPHSIDFTCVSSCTITVDAQVRPVCTDNSSSSSHPAKRYINGKLTLGEIIGISVGVIAVVFLIIIGGVLIRRRILHKGYIQYD